MKKTLTFICIALSLFVLCTVCAGALRLAQVESAAEEINVQLAERATTLNADGTKVYLAADATYSDVPEGASVDVGKTEAVYDAAAGTVTGSGYAGPVTITAEDGTVTTVVFCAPTKWKPGLNILTGTPAPFDMESEDAINLSFTTQTTNAGVRGSFSRDNDPTSDIGNHVINLTNGAATTLYNAKPMAPAIEAARPVHTEFEYYFTDSAKKEFYVLLNYTSNTIYKNLNSPATPTKPSSFIKKTIDDGKASKDVTGMAIQAQSGTTYLDNLAYIPYYKITYHLPDGESSEYVLYESGKLLTEYIVKTDKTPTAENKIFLGWTTEEGSHNTVSSVPLANEDVNLYPVWNDLIDTAPVYMDASSSHTLTVNTAKAADISWMVDVGNSEAVFDEETFTLTGAGYAGTVAITATVGDISETKYIYLCAPTKWKPGLNFLTGTTAPFDMESAEAINLSFTTKLSTETRGAFSRDNDPTGDLDNHVINVTRSGANATLYNAKKLTPTIEIGRPVYTEFEYYFTDLDKKDFYVLLNFTSGTIYRSLQGVSKPLSFMKKTVDGVEPKVDITGMAIQTGSGTTYLDNLAYIPYYKITYHMPDGAESSEYVLYQSGKLLTEYTVDINKAPTVENKIFLGWATEEGSSEPIRSVPLANEDVNLYPVWKEIVLIDTAPVYMDASSSYKVTVNTEAAANIQWTVDVGKSEAVFDEAKHTLTGAGYAGTVAITATVGDISETKYIYLCAPTKWKPGLNILTGTNNPFDMESAEAIDLTFSTSKTGTQRGTIVQANFPAGTNNNALKLIGSTAVTVYTKNSFAGIDKARPIQIAFNYSRSATYDFFTLTNATTDLQYKSVTDLGTAKPSSLTWKSIGSGTKLHEKCPDVITSLAIQAQHSKAEEHVTYLDSIEYIPYYKITYHLPDDTEQIEYVLYESDKKTLLTEYTVKTDNYPPLCLGWTTVEGGSEPVSSVPLANEDVDLYPVWGDTKFENSTEFSIRTTGTMGMRFSAFVTVAQRQAATEYGFISALAESFADGDYTKLEFPEDRIGNTALDEGVTQLGTLADGTRYIYATSYTNDGKVDIHSQVSGKDLFRINAVLVNIGEKDYQTNFVVRSYIRIENRYFYGDPMVNNLYQIAKESDNGNPVIQSIIDAVEGENA